MLESIPVTQINYQTVNLSSLYRSKSILLHLEVAFWALDLNVEWDGKSFSDCSLQQI